MFQDVDKLFFLQHFITEEVYNLNEKFDVSSTKKEINKAQKNAVGQKEIKQSKKIILREKEKKEAAKTLKQKLIYQGEQDKAKILIFTKYSNSYNIIPKDQLFLKNILKAIRLEINDIVIINMMKNRSLNFENIKKEFNTKIIISFGIKKDFFGVKYYNKPEIIDGIKILNLEYNLEYIAMNKKLKIELWKNLNYIYKL